MKSLFEPIPIAVQAWSLDDWFASWGGSKPIGLTVRGPAGIADRQRLLEIGEELARLVNQGDFLIDFTSGYDRPCFGISQGSENNPDA